ncbi:MAG: hypothetical protein ABH846_03260 [Patescibacteria group bacterium]
MLIKSKALVLGLSVFFLVLTFLAFYSYSQLSSVFEPEEAYAASITWDGGGDTGSCGAGNENNWSCATNWVGDVAPGSGDIAIFDGTNTKDAAIDASFAGSVAGIDINSGYTGTITQARSLTVGASNYAQDDGAFIGGTQQIDLNGTFTMTGGTFTATSGDFNIQGTLNTSAGGTFNHNDGTVIADGVSYQNWDVNSTITFYNFKLETTNTIRVQTNDFWYINNDYYHTTGYLNDSAGSEIYLLGDLTIGAASGNLSADMTLSGTGVQNITQNNTNSLRNDLTISKSSGSVELQTNLEFASGTFRMQGSTLNTNDHNIHTAATNWHTGGTINMGSGEFSTNQWSALYIQGATAVFNAGSGDMYVAYMNVQSNATFNAPTGTLYLYYNINNIGGNFNHNDSTVEIVQDSHFNFYLNTTINFYNLTINKTSNASNIIWDADETVIVENDLLMSVGNIATTGTLQAQGDVTIDPTFGTIAPPITFTGSNTQNLDLTGATDIWNSDMIISKSGGSVILASDLVMDGTDQDVIINTGTLDASASDYDITLGGNWTNNDTFTAQNGTVTIINSGATTTFTGDTDFYNLACTTTDKDLNFTAGSTTGVAGALTLTGTFGSEITLRSTVDSSPWYLNATGTTSVSDVDVKDSDASGGIIIAPTSWIDTGNNFNWVASATTRSKAPVLVKEAAVVINDNDSCTPSPNVTLRLFALNALEILVSESNLFTGTQWQEFIPTSLDTDPLPFMDVDWTLSDETATNQTIYTIFRSSTENQSEVVKDSIQLLPGVECHPEPAPEPEPDDIIDDISLINDGDLIQSPSYPTLSYVEADTRKPVLNDKIFYTWIDTLSTVKTVIDSIIPLYKIGAPLLPKPGVTLIKIQSLPYIYISTANPNDPTQTVLRRITDDSITAMIFGEDWKDYVLEIPSILFSKFLFGEVINSAGDIIIDTSQMKKVEDLHE